MASEKVHNPWLAKSRMFGETRQQRSVDYSRGEARALTLYRNELEFSIHSCYFFPAETDPKTSVPKFWPDKSWKITAVTQNEALQDIITTFLAKIGTEDSWGEASDSKWGIVE